MDSATWDAVWSGFDAIGDEPRIIAMWAIAAALLYVGIARQKEPLLLIPIAMGILLANMPVGVLVSSGGSGEPIGLLKLLQDAGLRTDLLPLLVFLGLGAAVDFEPMLSNPKTLLLGAGAQAGVFVALIGLSAGLTAFDETSLGVVLPTLRDGAWLRTAGELFFRRADQLLAPGDRFSYPQLDIETALVELDEKIDRFQIYESLLLPLENVQQNLKYQRNEI